MTPSVVRLLIVWSVPTIALVVLLIYRSTLLMHEDDQLFLGESEAHLEKEQADLMQKLNRIKPFLLGLGATSVVLILVIAGIAVYEGMTRPAF